MFFFLFLVVIFYIQKDIDYMNASINLTNKFFSQHGNNEP